MGDAHGLIDHPGAGMVFGGGKICHDGLAMRGQSVVRPPENLAHPCLNFFLQATPFRMILKMSLIQYTDFVQRDRVGWRIKNNLGIGVIGISQGGSGARTPTPFLSHSNLKKKIFR
jgi:hypothetical protein